tara:strand:+ start:441 stop:632 length:192 start_codon:yes stop_codon:yes gene_type:complete
MHNKTRRKRQPRIKVGTYFDSLTPPEKEKYKEKNRPAKCNCVANDLILSNGLYWYCGKCKEIK